MKEIETCRFLIVGTVLSCGYSFEVPDVFDVAYAVFEFGSGTPSLADMVQLCARVRCVGDRLLKYTVVSHPYALSRQDDPESTALASLRDDCPDDDDGSGLRLLVPTTVKEHYENRRHCASVTYARPCVREASFWRFRTRTQRSSFTDDPKWLFARLASSGAAPRKPSATRPASITRCCNVFRRESWSRASLRARGNRG